MRARILPKLSSVALLAQLALLSTFGCAEGLGCEELDIDGCYATPGCQFIEEYAPCAPVDGTGCFYLDPSECPSGTVAETVAGSDGRAGCSQAYRCADPNAPEGGAAS